ncbi:MAG: ECF-type sigma factor [Phycisphaerales bacterium]|jgi:RNA polymerase sigma-70 factor (ECF subfamily)
MGEGAPSASEGQVGPPTLVEQLYDELRSLAAHYLRGQASSHTLQPTALVNETFLKLARAKADSIKDRAHFLAIAATAMRQVLVNHAEARRAKKRGAGAAALPIDASIAAPDLGLSEVDVLAIEQGLKRLEALDERKARVVEAKIYGGLSHSEIATVLGVSLSTVEADWRMAKAWLARELSAGEPVGGDPSRVGGRTPVDRGEDSVS